jgi:hypothetical protein
MVRHFAWIWRLVLGAFLIAGISPQAHADNYPSKPIRLILPYSPGGIIDHTGRVPAQKLGDSIVIMDPADLKAAFAKVGNQPTGTSPQDDANFSSPNTNDGRRSSSTPRSSASKFTAPRIAVIVREGG